MWGHRGRTGGRCTGLAFVGSWFRLGTPQNPTTFSLSSHRPSFMSLVFSSRFLDLPYISDSFTPPLIFIHPLSTPQSNVTLIFHTFTPPTRTFFFKKNEVRERHWPSRQGHWIPFFCKKIYYNVVKLFCIQVPFPSVRLQCPPVLLLVFVFTPPLALHYI